MVLFARFSANDARVMVGTASLFGEEGGRQLYNVDGHNMRELPNRTEIAPIWMTSWDTDRETVAYAFKTPSSE